MYYLIPIMFVVDIRLYCEIFKKIIPITMLFITTNYI